MVSTSWKVKGCVSRRYLDGVLKLSERWVEGVWNLSGTCLERVWNVSGTCLERVWNVSGTFLERVWNVPGTCLEHIWNVSGFTLSFLAHNFFNLNNFVPKIPPPQKNKTHVDFLARASSLHLIALQAVD